MNNLNKRFFLPFFVAAGCLALALSAPAAQQVIKGRVTQVTKNLAPVGRLDPGSRMHLAIGLPLRNRETLTNLLEDIYQPSSPNFRRFLTADEFANSFGPGQEDYQAVIDFAKAHGLEVKATHPNRTLVDVSGKVGDIENAFHVHLRVYKHPAEARNFFAPDTEPALDLDVPVLAISGLDNYVKTRPQLRPLVSPDIRILGGGSSGGSGGSGGSGSGGSYMGTDFRKAYAPGIALMGEGQSVGLFELTGYDPDDISDYESEANLPNVNLQNILIDGYDGDDTNIDYAVEATSDIEMAISMAPGLDTVLVYEGPTPLYEAPIDTNAVQYSSTTAQINDVLNRMATDNLAKQLSCSYQMDVNLSTVQIFQQFAAQGQSFFQASGDSGAFPAAIDEPSDDPYVTVVGGTTLSTSSGAWKSEKVWLTPASYDPLVGSTPLEASGGGVSTTYAIPSWQQGISMTTNQGSTTMRNMPDVAMIADNVDIVYGNDAIGESFDFTISGTSLAAPLWAAYIALVNEQAAANGQPPVGFVNPAIYAIGKSTSYHSCFHDITTGNNFNPNSPTKYSATSGYDLCSGWGTMVGTNLMQALLRPPTETLQIAPPLGFTSFGPSQGPFSVTSQTYTLTNTGSQPLNWSVVNTTPWLNVSANSGTLNPGGPSATVTVSLNSAASNILIASYSGNVSFANLSTGTTQNRQFDLYVGNGGFETGDFTDWTYVGDTNLSFALAADDVDVGGTNALDGEPDELFVHSGLYGAYLGMWPNDGSLTHVIPTSVGQQLLVSFWLTSVPSQGETTPNDFTAKWNGTDLFYETNLDAFAWTNLQFVVSATGPSSTLEFDFSNTPGAFGLDDVVVGPIPAPVFQSAEINGSTINFTWSAYSNVVYQVQGANNLVNPVWTNVATPITANTNMVSVSESLAAGPQHFYRVMMMPGH